MSLSSSLADLYTDVTRTARLKADEALATVREHSLDTLRASDVGAWLRTTTGTVQGLVLPGTSPALPAASVSPGAPGDCWTCSLGRVLLIGGLIGVAYVLVKR